MSRWRPPQPRQSAYITPAGYAALKEELRVLWKERRPEATRKVAEAAALGDRSENADYIYGKRLLAEIDRRVRYLTKRLDDLTVVDRAPDDPDRVWFGARVTLEAGDGTERTWRIVGPDEIGPPGWISIDAPLARALLGRRRDDEVAIPSAAGPPQTVAISAIDYDFPRGSAA